MVTDFHSHILPGIDDGSASVEESIAMLQMEAAQGVRHVVATPHFYAQHDTPERFLRRRTEAEARLREEMEKHPGLPDLSVGAEVYFFRGISGWEILPELGIDRTGHILVEMYGAPWEEYVYQELEDIQARQGLTPVIAHVDRYIGPLRQYGIPERLAYLPVKVQANASFFVRPATRRLAMRILKNDQIHLLGSDCHDLTNRPPNLETAVRQIRRQLGDQAIDRIKTWERQLWKYGK